MSALQLDKRILVVDDDPSTMECICSVLKEAGFETTCAGNTVDALASMTSTSSNAMLLDINLFGESGLDFLPKFKKLHPGVPVVMLTGLGYDNSIIKAALQNGASGYFSKETGFENLIPVLEKLTSQ